MSDKPADKNDKSTTDKPLDKTAARQAPPRDKAAEEHDKEARAAASIGAQIILDYNSAASIAARGGAGTTIEENTQARDAHLVALGLDPNAASGPPPAGGPQEKPEPPPPPPAPPVSAKATRMSSLAAGIATGDNAPAATPQKP